MSRLACLTSMPGLEKNLRILLDWLLDIPFRRDISIITPKLTFKLTHAHYEAGDIIINEGEQGDCAYLLLSGKVEVLKNNEGKMIHVAYLNQGDYFGEMSLLTAMPRTATIKCVTTVEVAAIAHDQFMDLLKGFNDLDKIIKSKMIQRNE